MFMVMNAGQQNKNLRRAASQPKDTSPRLASSTNYSASISSSKRNESTGSPSNVNFENSNRRKIQGSFEGLIRSAPAYVQPNGSGYDNPKFYTARYKDRSFNLDTYSKGNILTQNKSYSIMNNYSSLTIKDSSSDRLSSMVKKNMMFK